VRRISPQAMRLLLDYSWPGNVRELANVIEYAVAVSGRETVLPEDLPQEILHASAAAAPFAEEPSEHVADTHPVHSPAQSLNLEETRLLSVLEKHHWRRGEAARELGLSRSTLWRKMREFHLV
jgi:transcriptional regulator of acetoin/glycerol metabolism